MFGFVVLPYRSLEEMSAPISLAAMAGTLSLSPDYRVLRRLVPRVPFRRSFGRQKRCLQVGRFRTSLAQIPVRNATTLAPEGRPTKVKITQAATLR